VDGKKTEYEGEFEYDPERSDDLPLAELVALIAGIENDDDDDEDEKDWRIGGFECYGSFIALGRKPPTHFREMFIKFAQIFVTGGSADGH
jgi:hypothetical protein